MTNRLAAYIVDKLSDERSFSSVAREVDISVSTVTETLIILETVFYIYSHIKNKEKHRGCRKSSLNEKVNANIIIKNYKYSKFQ